MYELLKGVRIVEGASFIAAPICCQHLLQMGAEVVRFDAIGGGPDFKRWPVDPSGRSLYWDGLNKGKKSIAINLAAPAGRALAAEIATAPGENAGLLVTNYPVDSFLSYERLATRRPDIIVTRVMGWADGRNAVDYTINAVTGLPFMTGPNEISEDQPVNHVLPAWDLITGSYAAFALMAAERQRRMTGTGGEVRIPLSDIAASTLGHLGQIAEVALNGHDRPRTGNNLFGAFGRDFVTADGERVMLVAITIKQWRSLLEALNLVEAVAELEKRLGVSFDDEGARYLHRAPLFELVGRRLGETTLPEAAAAMDRTGVCWSRYRSLHDAIRSEPGFVTGNPIFSQKGRPEDPPYPIPGSAATFPQLSRGAASRAPRLGEHTDQVLAEVLQLSAAEIGKLHDAGIVAGADM